MSTTAGCWRNAVFGAVTGGIVGGASAAMDVFASVRAAAKAGPRAAELARASALRAVAMRTAGSAGGFAVYQSSKCILAATEGEHGLSEEAQLGASAVAALLPAAALSLRGVPILQITSLLVLMDNARYFLPRAD